MSGIEVAGLLLGSFPLIISALENYRKIAEVYDDWWQVKKEFQKCKQELKCAELALESNLERFLLPLVVEDDMIEELMLDPAGEKWKNPNLEEKLMELLPKSYDLFLDTINEIQSVMVILKQELGVDKIQFMTVIDCSPGSETNSEKSSKTSLKKWITKPSADFLRNRRITKANMEFQKQRIKFGFGRATRTKLFEELARYNTRLRDLLDTSEKNTALKKSREGMKKSIASEMLWGFWRHAKTVYDLLTEAFNCRCKHLHRLQLQLQHQVYITDIELIVRLLYSTSMDPNPSPWTCRETTVKKLSEENGSRGIKIAVPTFQIGSRVPKPNPVPTTHGINDLCGKITTLSPGDQSIGRLDDGENSYSVSQAPNVLDLQFFNSVISLGQLLCASSPIKLNRRQRYSLALTVASSHLQLYSSAWLGSNWTKHDIVFAYAKDSNKIVLECPYISRACISHPSPMSSDPYAITDRTLPTLGILLIELCYGMPLEEHELRKQYQTPTSNASDSGSTSIITPSSDLDAALDLVVALEWSRSICDEAGERFADAVDWCLRNKPIKGKDSAWRKEIFTNVVEPLQYCHEQLSSK